MVVTTTGYVSSDNDVTDNIKQYTCLPDYVDLRMSSTVYSYVLSS